MPQLATNLVPSFAINCDKVKMMAQLATTYL